MRKANLAWAAPAPVRWHLPYDASEIAYDLFGAGCNLGLEGIVSKRLDRAYGTRKCAHWIKIKIPRIRPTRVRDKLLQSPPRTPRVAGS
jgi:bifunctional non-homologous end joining protein LigD